MEFESGFPAVRFHLKQQTARAAEGVKALCIPKKALPLRETPF